MRCLYCGKELALLKRWTSGGEFCSDAHRQQYQEEYNQLALNRLLQAKPPGEEKAPTGAKGQNAPAQPAPQPPAAEPARPPVTVTLPAFAEPVPASREPERHAVAVVEAPEPAKPVLEEAVREIEQVDEPDVVDENPAPADPAGFLLELPVPSITNAAAAATSSSVATAFDRNPHPSLPQRDFESWGTQLVAAGRIILNPSDRVLDYASRPSEGRLELREFVRTPPVVDFDFRGTGHVGSFETSEEPMEILLFPRPPQVSPVLWQEGEREFSFAIETGIALRIALRTTGVSDSEEEADSASLIATEAAKEAAAESAPQAAAETTVQRDVPERVAEPIARTAEPEPVRESPRGPASVVPITSRIADRVADRVEAAPERKEPEKIAMPAPSRPTFLRAPFGRPQERQARATAPAEPPPPPKKHDPVPDLITKPLPVTLHGLAAGRGKPVQIFNAAVSNATDIQVPRSAGLPLRPVMTLGPAPFKQEEKKSPERTILVRPDPKKSQPSRPDPRTGNGKGRKPEPELSEPEKKAAAPAAKEVREVVREAAKEAAKEASKEAAKDILKDTAALKEAPAKETTPKESAKPTPAVKETAPVKDAPAAKEKEVAAKAKEVPAAKEKEAGPTKEREVVATKETPKEKEKPAAAERKAEEPKPESKPVETKPAEKPAVVAEPARPAAAAAYSAPDLGLPSLSMEASGSFWSRLPIVGKIGVAALVVAAIAGAIVYASKSGGAAANTGPHVVEGPALSAAPDAGWITDWGAEPGVRRVHEISVLRPSLALSDYRMEFQAQIESKALGWIYRAIDGKNYYVNKIEIVKPGLEPSIALVRFAVVKGEEQTHAQFPINIPVRIDTLYKIRFEAVGDHFSTWVQDQKVDDWTDDRLKTGGIGLYNDRGERMSMTGSVAVIPLVIKR